MRVGKEASLGQPERSKGVFRRIVTAPADVLRWAVRHPKTTGAIGAVLLGAGEVLPVFGQEATPDASQTVQVLGQVNVRDTVGTAGTNILESLPAGTQLQVVDVADTGDGYDWWQVTQILRPGATEWEAFSGFVAREGHGNTFLQTAEPRVTPAPTPDAKETPTVEETQVPQVESVLTEHPEWTEFPEVVGTKLKTMQIMVNGKPFTINWFANLENLENFSVDFPGIMLPKDGSEAEIGAIVEAMLGSDYDPSKPLTVASFSSDEAIFNSKLTLEWPELGENETGARDFEVRGDVINVVLTAPMAMPKGVNYNSSYKGPDGGMHELPNAYFDPMVSEQGSNQLVVYLGGDSLAYEVSFTNLAMVAPFGWLHKYHELNTQCAQQFGESACQPGSEALRHLIMAELTAGYDTTLEAQLRRPSQGMSVVVLNPRVEGEPRTPTPTMAAAEATFEPITPKQ